MTGKTMILAALGALAAASPAAAQYAGAYGNVDIQGLRAEIDAAVSRGDVSSQDAYSLRSQLRGLIDLQRRYAMDGLNWNERNDLQQRAQGLRNEIADAEGSASGDDRYGNGDRYRTYSNGYDNGGGYRTYGNGYAAPQSYGADRNGTYGNGNYGNSYGANGYNRPYNDGRSGNYGSGQYTQYDRGDADARDDGRSARNDGYDRDDGRYDRDDGYDRDDDGYALRVGDRATGGLYAVPDAYRARFRDGGIVYYRYGGGNVYQIDARNNVVLRVIPIGR
jgi:hypothetical protein